MYLTRLSLLNFKNLAQEELLLDKGFNCFVGDNGTCKTNIIDAVYYLSMCKSSLAMTDLQCVRHGEKFFVLEGDYRTESDRHERVVCSYQRGASKVVKRNDKVYERLADHIGLIPVVIVSPADSSLISDAAEERRRYINGFISQLDKSYLEAAMRYNTALANRNSYLKMGSDEEMLRIYDAQMAPAAEKIHKARLEITELLYPLVCEYYRALSDDHEQVELEYRSELNNATLEELLSASRERDRIMGFTTCGVQRDDLRFSIGGYPLRKYGSQGQQKSIILALKMVQAELFYQQTGEYPVLLLDDITSEFDIKRRKYLMGQLENKQVIITGTEKTIVSEGLCPKLFKVEKGIISEV